MSSSGHWTISTLCLQSGPRGEAPDTQAGKVTISKDGSLSLREGNLTVATGQTVGNDSSRGRAQLKAGARELSVQRY